MFRVERLQSALDEMADACVRATPDEREAITLASHTVDRRLSEDAANEGESRHAGRRITFVPPLAVTFRVEPRLQTALVLHMRLFRPRH